MKKRKKNVQFLKISLEFELKTENKKEAVFYLLIQYKNVLYTRYLTDTACKRINDILHKDMMFHFVQQVIIAREHVYI